MNMERDLYQQLLQWKQSNRRKPLVLSGARQVGKTYALKKFGKEHYKQLVYLNFERESQLAQYFQTSLDPTQIIENLSLHSGINIEPGNTLIIFDEIQECPEAMNSLKYFCEEANNYHLASAGSLLGVKTIHGSGFPVGKVNFLHLYPLSFLEFLVATGNGQLRTHLDQLPSIAPIPSPLHDKLIGLLKKYMYIGGMPEVVSEFIRNGNYEQVREIQQEILSAYERDFAKHAPTHQVMKIVTVWQHIHQQLAKENKKFIFAAIKKSARGRDYEEAIQWLVDAGLVLKSYQVNTPKLPISAYADNNIFKLFLLDVGLLGAQANLAAKTIIEGETLFTEFKGSMTENFIAQSLVCSRRAELFYWSSSGTAELDFIIEHKQQIYPIEVKAGTSHKKKSLLIYDKKYNPKSLIRTSLMNLKKDGKVSNYPLYLLANFPI